MNIKIKGRTPLFLHKYTPSEDDGGRTKAEKEQDYKIEWKKGVYLDEISYVDEGKKIISNGIVYWPSTNMMQVLFDGTKGLNRGKVFFSRILFTSIRINPLKIYFKVEGKNVTLDRITKEDWIDVSGVKIGTSRVNRSRVLLPPEWELEFEIEKISDDLSDKEIRKIVENAGKSGMGDWRPSSPKKPGPYGTFELTS